MAHPAEDEDDEVVRFDVPIDMRTVAWLMELADLAHAPPALIIAAILRDVRQDDEQAHDGSQRTTEQPAHLN